MLKNTDTNVLYADLTTNNTSKYFKKKFDFKYDIKSESNLLQHKTLSLDDFLVTIADETDHLLPLLVNMYTKHIQHKLLLFTNNISRYFTDELQKNNIDLSTITVYGIDMSDDNTEYLNNLGMKTYSRDFINSVPKETLLKSSTSNECKTTVIVDGCIDADFDLVTSIIELFRNNTLSLNFVNIHGSDRKKSRLGAIFRNITVKIFDVKEKKINVYNEHSRFLIFRELEQKDGQDYGWFIFKAPKDITEECLQKLDHNKITSIYSDDKEYLLTSTTIEEQNDISYHGCKNITNLALFPEEKKRMIFELIN